MTAITPSRLCRMFGRRLDCNRTISFAEAPFSLEHLDFRNRRDTAERGSVGSHSAVLYF